MRLFVGLGNPGSKYAHNRHNIGFMAVDEIARRHGFSPWRRRFQGTTSEGSLDQEKVVLLRPETFMNESGRAVQEAANFFKIGVGDIVVFQDELELPPAKLRVKIGGGIAGHNGLRSISAYIGNDYRRVRLGSVTPVSRNWFTVTCCRISPRATGPGSRRSARRSRTTPPCLPVARTRHSRTRCIWRCRHADFSTRMTATLEPRGLRCQAFRTDHGI